MIIIVIDNVYGYSTCSCSVDIVIIVKWGNLGQSIILCYVGLQIYGSKGRSLPLML